jgi:hypothetical protein
MGKTRFSQKAIKGMQELSKYIAIVIRNAMEDFHCQHLSDAQMEELNPIIRSNHSQFCWDEFWVYCISVGGV